MATQALTSYGEHFRKSAQESTFEVDFSAFSDPSSNVSSKSVDTQDDSQVLAQLKKDLEEKTPQKVDCEEEDAQLCYHCNLPLGKSFYKKEDDKCIHGECLAKAMLHDMQEQVGARLQAASEHKKKCREEYGIGWNVEDIPRNDVAAAKLAMRDVPQGMICIALDEETEGIGLGSTLDPAAAVNLEYLSTALEVRRREGHEPAFSLDPVSSDPNSMQEKNFVPDWLEGTSVGEVLFQADYHLKELSMSEYDQPVVGMKSCFDYSELAQMKADWRAREWFMVRKAEVQISGNGVLRPYVKMGVEAREQGIGDDNMQQDKQITQADHPMVMYAEAFTRNFDLIAERKSVVYHLRELAKASVLAKYLLDTNVQIDDSWFCLATEKEVPSASQVPQLWNEHVFAKVAVEDGVVSDKSHMHGVYGGVRFGLDKFQLATSVSKAPGAAISAGMPKHRLAYGLSHRAGLAPVSNIMSMATGAQFAPPSAAISAAAPVGVPRLAASIGVSPLRAGLKPPSAALSATIAPRLATSVSGVVSASLAAAPRLAASLGPMGVGKAVPPRLTTSAAFIGAPPRLATSVAASIGAAPRLATSVAASIGAAPRMATMKASIGAVPRLATSVMPPTRLAAQLSGAARPATSIASTIGAVPARLQTSIASTIGAVPARLQTSVASTIGAVPARLQGVDLGLDSFDLSEAKHVSPESQEGSWSGELQSLDECVPLGKTFWSSLEENIGIFKDEDRTLLRQVFNPKLSDRRSEGDLFAPPDASHSYVTKLRALVKEEETVRQRRKANFCAKAFSVDEPDSVFPFSWKSSFKARIQQCPGVLAARPEYMDQAAELLQGSLQDRAPFFDKSTEDGIHFRIYSLGSLEVRTIQEVDGEEVVGAVFSRQEA